MSSTRTDLGKGIIYEVVHDGRIHIYHIDNDSREAYQVLFQHLEEMIEYHRGRDELVRTLYNFSQVTGLTRFGRDEGAKMIRNLPPDYRARTALVLPQTTMGRVVKSVVQTLNMLARNPNLETDFFLEYDAALAWLEESL